MSGGLVQGLFKRRRIHCHFASRIPSSPSCLTTSRPQFVPLCSPPRYITDRSRSKRLLWGPKAHLVRTASAQWPTTLNPKSVPLSSPHCCITDGSCSHILIWVPSSTVPETRLTRTAGVVGPTLSTPAALLPVHFSKLCLLGWTSPSPVLTAICCPCVVHSRIISRIEYPDKNGSRHPSGGDSINGSCVRCVASCGLTRVRLSIVTGFSCSRT